ncbi:MAG: hypothetical protein ACXWNR_01200 [Candidatus Limnocylindrales bacterium]
MLAGALISVAAFMPWEASGGWSQNGFEFGAAGVLSLCIGMVVAVAGLTQMHGGRIGAAIRMVAFLGGLAAMCLAMLSWAAILLTDYPLADGAIGLLMVAVGGGLAIGASLIPQRGSA